MLKQQYGLSLVEIMVALVISIFLLGGIVQVYVGNKTTYRFSDASARIQENGRFALDNITTDVRLAGFFGCVDMTRNPDLVQNHLNTTSPTYDFINQRPIVLNANAGLNGSDNLTIKGSKAGQTVLSANLPMPGSAALQVTGNNVFQNNDIVLITNCWTSDIFEVSSVSSSAGVTTLTHTVGTTGDNPGNMALNPCAGGGHCLNGGMDSNLETTYTANNTTTYILQNVVYSIQPSGSGSGEPALWRSENNDNQELIEGVEQMLVMYGLDTDTPPDGAPNQYVNSTTALAATDTITSVRVTLVVRSDEDNVMETNQNYTVNGVDTTAPDRRLRQVFTTTVDLRNR